MINTASKWIGYLEHKSEDALGFYTENVGKGGYTVFAYLIRRCYPYRNFAGLPWCATFLHWVFIEALGKEKARRLLGKPHPGTRVLFKRLRRRGLIRPKEYIPSMEDVMFLHNGDGRISHCAIVVGVEGDTVTTIEGNTVDPTGVFDKTAGGAVAKRERSLSDELIVCYGCVSTLID